jgi:hypothetical protein
MNQVEKAAFPLAVKESPSEQPGHQRQKLWWALRICVALGILISGFVGAGLVWRFFVSQRQ